jgi:hypothetical protein
MAKPAEPSPIITYFTGEIEPFLGKEAKARLATYNDAIAKTTHHGDFRRAWHCADWAIAQAERSSNSRMDHLVKGLKEKHQLSKDTIFGAEFGMIRDGIGPGQDAEIQWVDDAVAVAREQATSDGWDAVKWEDLLKEMLAVAPPEG